MQRQQLPSSSSGGKPQARGQGAQSLQPSDASSVMQVWKKLSGVGFDTWLGSSYGFSWVVVEELWQPFAVIKEACWLHPTESGVAYWLYKRESISRPIKLSANIFSEGKHIYFALKHQRRNHKWNGSNRHTANFTRNTVIQNKILIMVKSMRILPSTAAGPGRYSASLAHRDFRLFRQLLTTASLTRPLAGPISVSF